MTRSPRIERRAFVARLIAAVPRALVVTGLGSPAYDVFAAGDRDRNFYLWGAMGGAAALGLGLALAQRDEPVLVVTGDGEQLMGVGSLATIAAKRPPNLSIVVLDNAHYGETGMQPSHTGLGTELVAVARGFGIADARRITRIEEAEPLGRRIGTCQGLLFAQVVIDPAEQSRALPPRDGPFVKNRFRNALGLAPL